MGVQVCPCVCVRMCGSSTSTYLGGWMVCQKLGYHPPRLSERQTTTNKYAKGWLFPLFYAPSILMQKNWQNMREHGCNNCTLIVIRFFGGGYTKRHKNTARKKTRINSILRFKTHFSECSVNSRRLFCCCSACTSVDGQRWFGWFRADTKVIINRVINN